MSFSMPNIARAGFGASVALGVTLGLAVGLMVPSARAQSLPGKAVPLQHVAKRKPVSRGTSVKVLPIGQTIPARTGPVSPYVRAAERRAQSGEPPPGHPMVRRQAAPTPQ